jgi:hypothetical protein
VLFVLALKAIKLFLLFVICTSQLFAIFLAVEKLEERFLDLYIFLPWNRREKPRGS